MMIIIIKPVILKVENRRLRGVKCPSERSNVPRNIHRKKLKIIHNMTCVSNCNVMI